MLHEHKQSAKKVEWGPSWPKAKGFQAQNRLFHGKLSKILFVDANFPFSYHRSRIMVFYNQRIPAYTAYTHLYYECFAHS